MHTVHLIFGQGQHLTTWQVCLRSVFIFFTALFFIRVAGMRTFGRKSAFDVIVGITIGAMLSRAILGISPFVQTILASFIIVVLHRLIALLSFVSPVISRLVKGDSRLLYKDGTFFDYKMKRSSVNEQDLMESVRHEGNVNNLNTISEIYIESNGEISIIKTN